MTRIVAPTGSDGPERPVLSGIPTPEPGADEALDTSVAPGTEIRRAARATVAKLVADGEITMAIAKTYPLTETAAAPRQPDRPHPGQARRHPLTGTEMDRLYPGQPHGSRPGPLGATTRQGG